MHKIFAGVLDVWMYNGNQQALSIATTLTDEWLIPYVMLSTLSCQICHACSPAYCLHNGLK